MQQVAAHEFGHALGIDGHSDVPTDLMFSVIDSDHPQTISARDLNTLECLYSSWFGRGASLPSTFGGGGRLNTTIIEDGATSKTH